jgi:hypothetical protein
MESFEYKSEKEKIEELKSILITKAEDRGFIVVHEKIVEFVDKLEKQYKIDSTAGIDESIHQIGHPKLNPIRLYHVLIGSNTDSESVKLFDLPNGEIEKFIREEL